MYKKMKTSAREQKDSVRRGVSGVQGPGEGFLPIEEEKNTKNDW